MQFSYLAINPRAPLATAEDDTVDGNDNEKKEVQEKHETEDVKENPNKEGAAATAPPAPQPQPPKQEELTVKIALKGCDSYFAQFHLVFIKIGRAEEG